MSGLLDTLFWWTGLVTWVFLVCYVVPLLPVIVFTFCGALVHRIERWWTDTYMETDSNNRRQRYEEYAEYRETGYWRASVSLWLVRIKRLYYTVAEAYWECVGPLHGRLPFISY